MPQQGFNFQELVRQLGLKNVDELPVVHALTPVINVGDGSGLTSPLLPPSAFAGGVQAVVAGERASLQLLSLGVGGIILLEFRVGGATQTAFQLNLAGAGNPLAADTIVGGGATNNDIGFTPALSRVVIGTSTVSLDTVPRRAASLFTGLSSGEWAHPMFLPHGSLFTIQNSTIAQVGYFSIIWRELPAAALTPTG